MQVGELHRAAERAGTEPGQVEPLRHGADTERTADRPVLHPAPIQDVLRGRPLSSLAGVGTCHGDGCPARPQVAESSGDGPVRAQMGEQAQGHGSWGVPEGREVAGCP